MEFTRAIAHACFKAGMWLMVVTGILFLVLALAQYLRSEANADPVLTIGTGVVCLVLALVLGTLSKRVLIVSGN